MPYQDFLHALEIVEEISYSMAKSSWLPMIMFCGSWISLNPFFDNWSWPFQIRWFFASLFGLVVVCFLAASYQAQSARREFLGILRRDLVQSIQGAKGYNNEDEKILEVVIQEIGNLSRGIFDAFRRQPIVIGGVVLIGGTGFLNIVEKVTSMI